MKLVNKALNTLGLEFKSDHGLMSYSQEGEDMVLRRFLEDKKPGFYVDIGAHHPERFSNTAFYSKRGWTGINVDADPDLMDAFKAARPNDINLSLGVGQKEGSMEFFLFNEKALNTFDSRLAKQRANIVGYSIVSTKKIKITSLENIFKKHLPKGRLIDFMTVDVEGRDLDVLKSNNWAAYRPRILITECLKSRELLNISEDPLVEYMRLNGYIPVAKTLYSIFFKDTQND